MKQIISLVIFIAIYTTSNLYAQESVSELTERMKKENYMIAPGSATNDYIILINKYINEHEPKKATQLCQKLVKWSDEASNDVTKRKALELFLRISTDKRNKEVLHLLKNKKIYYKKEVLAALTPLKPDSTLFIELNKQFRKFDTSTHITIVDWLTSLNQDSINLHTLYLQEQVAALLLTDTAYTHKEYIAYFLAAIPNNVSALALANMVCSEDPSSIIIAQEALVKYPGPIEYKLGKLLFSCNDKSKLAVLDIFQKRKSSDCIGEVIAVINTTDSDAVKLKAYETLQYISLLEHLETLKVLQSTAEPEYKEIVDKAIGNLL